MASFKPALAFLKAVGITEEAAQGINTRYAHSAVAYADAAIAEWREANRATTLPNGLPLPLGTQGEYLYPPLSTEVRHRFTRVVVSGRQQGDGIVEGNETDQKWVKIATEKFKSQQKKGGNPDPLPSQQAKKSKKKGGRVAAKKKQAQDGTIYQREQAFLLQNIQDILGKENAPPPLQHHLPRLTVVSTENTLAGELLSPKEKLLSLMSVSPKDLSALTPYIRIYKRDKDLSTGKTRIREFKFSSHSPDLYEYLKPNSKGSGANIGLKSFNFEMTGDNNYTSTRKMKSELVLYFKSFNELGTSESDDETIGWQELLFAHNSDVYDPANDTSIVVEDDGNFDSSEPALDRSAQILVELGYNFSDKIIENQELRDAVVDSRMLLGINPTTNEFNFNEDGSSEVTLSGIAHLESIGSESTANVLELGVVEEDLTELGRLEELLRETVKNIEDEDQSKARAELKKQKTVTEKNIKKKRKQHASDRYGGFIKFLYDNQRLFSFTIKEAEYKEGKLPPDTNFTPINEGSAPAAAEMVPGGGGTGSNKHRLPRGLDAKKDKANNHTIGYFYLGDLLNYMAYALVDVKDRANFAGADVPAFIPPDTTGLDTIDAELAIAVARLDYDSSVVINQYSALASLPQASEIIVGDFYFHVFPPETGLGSDAWEEKDWYQNPHRENLTKLPIAWSLFDVFMQKHVIKSNRSFYNFAAFLNDAVEELVVAALEVGVANRIRNNKKVQKNKIIALANRISRTFASGISPGLIAARQQGTGANFDDPVLAEFLSPSWKITKPEMERFLGKTGDDPQDLTNFICIGGSMLPFNRDVGKDEQEDAKVGIYHMRGGSATGIVKSLSFTQASSRQTDIALQAALKRGDTSLGLGIFKQRYDAEVTIYGNPSFYPGQQLFLNPSIAGLGDIQAAKGIARKLGLGGLYQIQTIAVDLGIGTLMSTLSCQQTVSDFGNDQGEE
jgi:hypothetical protein